VPSPDTVPVIDPLPVGDTLTPIPLQELVVDILRSPMLMEAAPFAVSALTDELWTTGRSQSSLEEALQGMPGVQIHNRFNDAVGERVSIRGYGSRSEFGVRGITIMVDGIPATMPDGQSTLDHLDLGSLGRVEALRGPGSALYGNAAGGVLQFETRAPAEAGVRQEIRVIEGEHDYRRRQSTTSGRVGEVGYLVNLSRYEWGGYRADPLAGGAPAGAPVPVYGSAVRDHLNAHVSGPFMGGQVRLTANAMELDAEDPGAISAVQLAAGDRRAFDGSVTQRAGKDASQQQAGVRWEGPIGDRQLELSLYGIRHSLDNPTVPSWLELDRRVAGLRTMLRSEHVGEEGRLWWAVGVDADVQRDHRLHYQNVNGARGLRRLDQHERVTGGAVFLQALLPINPVLDVLTGLRYDRIRFSARDRLPFEDGSGEDLGARTLDSASPSFGVHARFHEAVNVYLNLSTAFETPTTSELANRPDGIRGFNPDLEPQVGITTEMGVRGILAERLAWEAVFFHTTLYNELVPFEVEDAPGQRYFRNSGRSSREGWELSLQFAPSRILRTRLVVSTNDARFREFEMDGVDYTGNRVPGLAPRRVEGIVSLGPGSWFAEVRGEATAAIHGNNANMADARSPAYRVVDVRAGVNEFRLLGLRLSPFLGVTNLLDEVYVTSVVVNAADGRYFEPGPGRAFYMGTSLAVQF
jgi:iron complex outermembrane recepter protein